MRTDPYLSICYLLRILQDLKVNGPSNVYAYPRISVSTITGFMIRQGVSHG